jgi:hypothetical protein
MPFEAIGLGATRAVRRRLGLPGRGLAAILSMLACLRWRPVPIYRQGRLPGGRRRL